MQAQNEVEITAETKEIGVALEEFRDMQSEYPEQPQRDKVKIQPRIVSRYYDIVTNFYEFGWGTSFHFAPRTGGENLVASQHRMQEEIARLLGLEAGMIAGDIGCGIGGPMLHVVRTSGADVVGINISKRQILRGQVLVKKAGFEERCSFAHASFLDLPQPEAHFDAIYSIEAICHSPDRNRAFGEIFRTLKPGGKFVIFDWVLTELYDDNDARHKDIRGRVEYANATPNLFTAKEQVDCIRQAGFEILHAADHALTSEPETPWYVSLESRDMSLSSLARMPVGRAITASVTRVLEWLRLAPAGTSDAARMLNVAADALVESGQLGIFTPSFLVHARKPEAA